MNHRPWNQTAAAGAASRACRAAPARPARRFFWSLLLLCGACGPGAWAADFPAWRGLEQNGAVRENAVVTEWSPDGKNLLWKSPVGGRTTPIIMGGRVYFNAPHGEGECSQEAVYCLDAATGALLWQQTYSVYLTDIVENRVGWPAMAGDPQTQLVYAHLTGGEFACLDRDGKERWKVSLSEALGRISGYGGRLHTPVIVGDVVIISFSNSSWGDQAKPLHRLLALDKISGEAVWWSASLVRPIDPTVYATPVSAVVEGRHLLVFGAGDGFVYGLDADTGEILWKYQLSKLGLNSSPVVDGKHVYITHSEENLHTTQMGAVVCINAALRGDITEQGTVWRVDGVDAGYASPALSGGRLYVVDNSANLLAFDAASGQRLWRHNVGRVGKGSPVVTQDGVIYVTEQNGILQILRDAGTSCTVLHSHEFTRPDGLVDEIFGSPAVVDGRVYLVTRYGTYCLGKPGAEVTRGQAPAAAPPDPAAYAGRRFLRVTPAEATLSPGRERAFYAELFDGAKVIVDPQGLQWSLEGLPGTISPDGMVVPERDRFGAGYVVASLGDTQAKARVRVMARRPPMSFDFEELQPGAVPPGWVGIAGKTKVLERDGSKVLMKLAEDPSAPFTRIRGFLAPPIAGGYIIEADLLGTPKGERHKPDMGLINTRYLLVMRGSGQQLRLVAWDSVPRLQRDLDFPWQTDVWYRARLQVQLRESDALVRAKVWPRDQAEPESWNIEMTDACPHREGSPGIYGYSTGTTAKSKGTEIFYDNIQVIQNEE